MRVITSVSLLVLAAPALAVEWKMLEDSQFLFEASWEGTPLPGRFGEFDVRIEMDTGDVTSSSLTVTVELAGADMDDPDINEAIAGPEWFSIAEFPIATFTSQTIAGDAPGTYVASGELELKGIRKALDVPFTWSESGDRAEMTGELILDRTQRRRCRVSSFPTESTTSRQVLPARRFGRPSVSHRQTL